MKPILWLTALLAFLLLQSCAFHKGIMTSNVQLTDGNFRMVKTANGYAKATYILGIGGLKKNALVHNARKDMYLRYPLQPGQAFANISVDFKRAYFPLVGITSVYVTADVIEFGPQMPVLENQRDTRFFAFKDRDEVILFRHNTFLRGTLEFVGKSRRVRLVDGGMEPISTGRSGSGYVELSDYENLFLSGENVHISNSKFQMGDRLSEDEYGVEGTVMGINENRLLLQTATGAEVVQTRKLLNQDQ